MDINWASQSGNIQQTVSRFFVVFTLVLAACYSFLILAYSWLVEDNIFNRLVMNEAHYVEQSFKDTGVVSKPRVSYMTLHAGWNSLPQKVQEQFQNKPSQVEFLLDSGETLHIQLLKLGDTDYVLAAKVAEFEVSRDYLPHVTGYLLFIILALSLAALFVAWKVAFRITAPIQRLATEVSVVGDGSVAEGFSDSFPNNEIGFLAKSIETNVLKLQAAMAREVNFTKDVSHELKTPITVLKNLQSQIKQGQVLQERQLQQFGDSVLALEQMTQTLLALARNESAKTIDTDLVELLESCLLSHHGLNHTQKGQQIEVVTDWPDTYRIPTNPQLMEILLNNVLSNAVNYASESKLNITLKEHSLSFENTFDQAPLNAIEKSGVKGKQSHGIGQGLSLIQRICQQFNWQFQVEQSQHKFRLTINLSAPD